MRDDLAAARAVLKKHSTMLLTASKVYVRHPELDLAKVNRDYVFKEVCMAVNTISDVAQGKSNQPVDMFSGAGELAAALDDFDVCYCQCFLFIYDCTNILLFYFIGRNCY